MTQRQKAAYHYWQHREALAAPRHLRTGAEVEAILHRLPNFKPIASPWSNVRCYACDQMIDFAHTCFVADGHPHPAPVLCYSCGIGWCIHTQRCTIECFDDLPAIGGPRS